jgi:branched-chain amino acid transport system substrate-binding protein
MKKNMLLISLVLLLAMGLVITGCPPVVVPPPVEPPVLGVDVIRIGGQGVTSGPHADYGWQMMAGATLAIEEINAAGGILGSRLELKFLDEELSPAVAVMNARHLVLDWGAHFLFGVDSSGVALAVGPVLEELDTLQLFCHAATHRLTEELVYRDGISQIVRVSVPIYQDSILAAIIFSCRERFPNVTRWAGINAAYEYGFVAWDMFTYTLRKLRPEVEFVATAEAPFWTIDFLPHVSAVMAAEPDAIFATPWGGEAIMMLRKALLLGVFDEIDVWWQAMGGSVDVLEGLSREIRADKFRGRLWATARYIFNWPDTAENRAFVTAFRDRWGRFPNYSAEHAYTSIYVLKAAIEEARSLETAKVIEAIRGMEIMTPAGMRYFRAADHQAIYNVPAGRIMMCPDGYWPIPIVGDLIVVPAQDYFRSPPFEPVPAFVP